MSLLSALGASVSALNVSQLGIAVTSRNIANVSTPGYARGQLDQSAVNLPGGDLTGVRADGVRRAADRFLAAAQLGAQAKSGAASARADLLSQAQQTFGDPNQPGSVFGRIEAAYGTFTRLQTNPGSSVLRAQVVEGVQAALEGFRRTSGDLDQLRVQADDRIREEVDGVNDLLRRIVQANQDVIAARSGGIDATPAENGRSALLDQLGARLDIRVTETSSGAVDVRTLAGGFLAGQRAAVIRAASGTGPNAGPTQLELVGPDGSASAFDPLVRAGSLGGLLQTRNGDLPALVEGLAGLAAAFAESLNGAHNAGSSVPAPNSLTGRITGLVASDPAGFSGNLRLAVIGAGNGVADRVDIPLAGLTVQGVVDAINNSLTGVTASFTNGQLSLTAPAGQGLALGDGNPPALKNGRGFSQAFGLNDLIQRPTPISFDTGFSGTEAAALTGIVAFRVVDGAGRLQSRSVDFTNLPASATLADAADAIGTALAPFGSASISGGRLQITPLNGAAISVTNDTSARGGLTLSALFGLSSAAQAGRAYELDVRADLRANPDRLALARPDLVPGAVLERGDTRGAQALAGARNTVRAIPATLLAGAQTASVATLSARLGSEIGRRAEQAQNDSDFNASLAQAAGERRANAEGVNLDDELLRLTQYQQAYSAAARVVQAVNDLFDVLFSIR